MEATFSAQESTRKRRRWGCACGCLIFVLGLLGGGVVLSYYALFRSNVISPKDHLMTAETDGFGVIHLNMDDQGLAEVLTANSRRIDKDDSGQLTAKEKKNITDSIKVVRKILPLLIRTDIPVYFSHDPLGQRERYIAMINLPRVGSSMLARLMLHENKPLLEKVDSTEIYSLAGEKDSSGTLAGISRGRIFLTNDYDMLRKAIAAEAEPKKSGSPADALQQYTDEVTFDNPSPGEDLSLVFVNTNERFQQMLAKVEERFGASGLVNSFQRALAAQKLAFRDILALKIACDLSSSDKGRVEITLFCRQPEIGKKIGDIAKAHIAQHLRKGDDSLLKKTDVKVQGSSVIITADFAGLKLFTTNVLPVGKMETAPAEKTSASP